jgi:hypothetical protein
MSQFDPSLFDTPPLQKPLRIAKTTVFEPATISGNRQLTWRMAAVWYLQR